jgi:hypothetical protein
MQLARQPELVLESDSRAIRSPSRYATAWWGGSAADACHTEASNLGACCGRGAGAEVRTRTPLRAAEFKSAASASSATPARESA